MGKHPQHPGTILIATKPCWNLIPEDPKRRNPYEFSTNVVNPITNLPLDGLYNP